MYNMITELTLTSNNYFLKLNQHVEDLLYENFKELFWQVRDAFSDNRLLVFASQE